VCAACQAATTRRACGTGSTGTRQQFGASGAGPGSACEPQSSVPSAETSLGGPCRLVDPARQGCRCAKSRQFCTTGKVCFRLQCNKGAQSSGRAQGPGWVPAASREHERAREAGSTRGTERSPARSRGRCDHGSHQLCHLEDAPSCVGPIPRRASTQKTNTRSTLLLSVPESATATQDADAPSVWRRSAVNARTPHEDRSGNAASDAPVPPQLRRAARSANGPPAREISNRRPDLWAPLESAGNPRTRLPIPCWTCPRSFERRAVASNRPLLARL